MPDAWYSSFDTRSRVLGRGHQQLFTRLRRHAHTHWYACEGDVSVAQCKSVFDDSGQFNIGNIPGQSSVAVDSSDLWSPGSNAEGIYTVVYTFSQNDQMASDDEFRFNINLTEDFVDVVADIDHNPISHVQNLAVYDGEQVLNTGTDYVFKAKGESTLCGVCTFSGQFGWQLWDADDTTMLKEAYKTVANLPAWGGTDPYNINLPAFNFGQEGRFLPKYGLFSSTGNPYADLNPSNNLASFEIVLNDSIDLKAVDVSQPQRTILAVLLRYRPCHLDLRQPWQHVGGKHLGLLPSLQLTVRP